MGPTRCVVTGCNADEFDGGYCLNHLPAHAVARYFWRRDGGDRAKVVAAKREWEQNLLHGFGDVEEDDYGEDSKP